jgi:hypothetical protein
MLTPDQLARLRMLRDARDQLAMGKAVASIEYAGERREFAKADLPTLDRLIGELTGGYGTVRIRM